MLEEKDGAAPERAGAPYEHRKTLKPMGEYKVSEKKYLFTDGRKSEQAIFAKSALATLTWPGFFQHDGTNFLLIFIALGRKPERKKSFLK